jgi:hypothetical protein
LIWTSGGNIDDQHLEQFALWWGAFVIHARMEHTSVGQLKRNVVSNLTLRGIDVPDVLRPQTYEILNILKEALIEYRVGGFGINVASHEAKFDF